MATNYYKTNIHQHSLRRRHSIGSCPPHSTTTTAAASAALPTSSFSKNNQPSNNISVSSSLSSSLSGFSQLIPTSSLFSRNNIGSSSSGFSHLIVHSLSLSSSSSTASTSSQPASVSFDSLEQHLSSGDFRQADEETRRLIIVLAGEAAEKRGYVFFSEVQFVSESDLKTIDSLWLKHSNNRFGYSVQKKLWEKVDGDFTRLFIKLGWMKKLDTEVVQYNYRSFPAEFIWELNDDTPEGHLPLTNALRGTRLLNCILNHPAFKTEEDGEGDEEDSSEGKEEIVSSSRLLKNKRVFKTDYSF